MEPKAELGAALIDMSRAASRLVNFAIGRVPPASSLADEHLAAASDGPAWTTSSVRRSHEGLLSADLAGIDHMRALAALLRSPIATSVSYATAARGAVEAFSRVHWLLSASSAAELVQRYVSLALGDISFAKKLQPDVPLKTGSNDSLTVKDYEQRLKGWLVNYPETIVTRVSRTQLAADLLEVAVRDGRVKYSQLSGIAHGESVMVNAFLDLESSRTCPKREMTLHLPLTFAIEFAGNALVICAGQHNAIAEYFSVPTAEVDRWAAARDRAMVRFRGIDLAYRHDSTDEL